MIPQAKVHWRDVWLAAVTTGIAFTVVNYILGTYIQTFTVTTVIGAAGSLLIILLWVYILNQIVLFGAEISKAYATTLGPHAKKHLPEVAQKIAKPIEEAGEKIEQATKGQMEETAEVSGEQNKQGKTPKKLPVPAPKKKEEPLSKETDMPKIVPQKTDSTLQPTVSAPVAEKSSFVFSVRKKKSEEEQQNQEY